MADSYDVFLSASVNNVKTIDLLLSHFGTAREVFSAKEAELLSLKLPNSVLSAFSDPYKDERRKRLYDYMEKNVIRVVLRSEPSYPVRFMCLSDRPYALYYQGTLPKPDCPAVAVIGSRRASAYGGNVASYFASALSAVGITVISGLALGIDGISHKASVSNPGGTVAVLGSGIGVPYPKENWALYKEIREKGCILSEHGPEVPALKQNFPHRNRIISALSDGILVVEAAEKSGTLITVDRGLEQGKEIYAIPGRIGDKNSGGCNNLIKQGARLITDPQEIIDDLAVNYPKLYRFSQNTSQITMHFSHDDGFDDKLSNYSENMNLGLAVEEKVVYDLCRLDAEHFDALLEKSGLTVSELSEVLYSLEQKGFVRQTVPNHYAGYRPERSEQ